VSDLVGWLNGLPTVVLFLGMTAIGLVVGFGLSRLWPHVIEDDVRSRTSGSVITVIGVVAGIYAVLIGFVIVNEWQNFDDAQTNVSNESAAIATTVFAASTLPDPTREDLRKALVRYVRSVVCVELPALAEDPAPSRATALALRNVFRTVASAPADVQAAPLYGTVVDEIANVATARRARINDASSPVPDLLLIVIFLMSISLVAAVSVLDTQHKRWHLVLTIGVSILVALNLALVVALDRPFEGAATVSDAPYREGFPSASLRCR
jgi:uncharacterized membrane protein